MSNKVRIHDLAKRYGMPGKDLAAKLRDYGFTKARTHMSALDDFELVQAEGLLQANGIAPVATSEETHTDEAPKSTMLKRKVRRKAETPDPEEDAPASPAPAETPVAESEPQPQEPVAETAPVEAPAPVAEPQPAAAEAPAPAAQPTEAPAASEVTPEPTAEIAQEAPAAAPAPAAAAEPVSEPEVAEKATPAEAPGAPEAPASADATPKEAKVETPAAESAEKPKAKAKKKVVINPKGNVIGFIDPSTFQSQNAPRGKHQTRRLVGRDDVTPDVRPSLGRGPREKTGPRGNLTATQLREREQGRFLRRSGPRGRGGSRRGGRGARGPREEVTESPLSGTTVVIETPITVAKLSEALKLKSSVVQKMAMEKQYGMFTLNASLDEDTATLLASEYEVELDVRESKSAEDVHLEEFIQQRSEVEDSELVDRAPTIAVLGHVDHGKTTLVDYLRSTKIADGEAGGITQHMGAYQITSKDGKKITVLDTPGHAAFTAMRARGAKAVDVVVLVVAGDDGVKPSTEEAVNHAKAAGTPIVVAINKCDKPNFNANTVIQQLMGFELVPEQYGGNTAMFEISALKGTGIDAMIQHLILMGEAELGLKAHPKGTASGVVLEAEIQQGRGIVAHLLVQDGSLTKGDILLAGEGYGRIKSIQDDVGKTLKSAGPATPVAVTGLDALPGVGDTFYIVDSLAKAKEIASDRAYENRAKVLAASTTPRKDLEAMLGRSGPEKTIINLLVRADVQGSLEAIRYEVAKLVHDEVEFKIVHSGVGPITESDVSLGITSEAILMAFQVGVAGKVRKEAERNHLSIRRYNVIYELLNDLRDLMEGALAPDLEEVVTGHVEIRRIFRSSKIGAIAGCIVLDGIVNRNSKVRLLRDGTVIYNGEIGSLKREAQDAGEVREGFECGILLKNYGDLKEGDIIETFSVKEIKRKLEI